LDCAFLKDSQRGNLIVLILRNKTFICSLRIHLFITHKQTINLLNVCFQETPQTQKTRNVLSMQRTATNLIVTFQLISDAVF